MRRNRGLFESRSSNRTPRVHGEVGIFRRAAGMTRETCRTKLPRQRECYPIDSSFSQRDISEASSSSMAAIREFALAISAPSRL